MHLQLFPLCFKLLELSKYNEYQKRTVNLVGTMNGTDLESFNKTYLSTAFITECIIVLPTVFGNFLLIYCITRYRALHTRSYILIANLAVSDLMFGLIFLPFDMLSVAVKEIRENKTACLLRNALMFDFIGASTFILLIISIERFIAVTYPLWHLKLSKKMVFGAIGMAWTLSTVLSILPLLGWNSWNYSKKCKDKWHDSLTNGYKTLIVVIYVTTIFICICLFIKVVVTTFAFLNNQMNNSGNILRYSTRTVRTSVEKTKLLILVLGVFVLCWGPYCVVVILNTFIISENQQTLLAEMYCGLLAFCNSALNWIIYGLKNRNIRQAFKRTLCKWRSRSTACSMDQSSSQFRHVSSISL